MMAVPEQHIRRDPDHEHRDPDHDARKRKTRPETQVWPRERHDQPETDRESHRVEPLSRQRNVSLDADVIQLADVPGVSAPNPVGFPGAAMVALARQAGKSLWVSSFDLVEISPPCDINGQSSRWAALVIWNFLIGLALRRGKGN